MATSDVFEVLTEKQMEVLNECKILQYIVQNRKKSFVSKHHTIFPLIMAQGAMTNF